jgi:uncharacterized coiled-coil protein SlyX
MTQEVLPPDVAVDAYCWFEHPIHGEEIFHWDSGLKWWWRGDIFFWPAEIEAKHGWSYLRPCPTPSELAALDAALHEAEATVAEQTATIEELRETNATWQLGAEHATKNIGTLLEMRERDRAEIAALRAELRTLRGQLAEAEARVPEEWMP